MSGASDDNAAAAATVNGSSSGHIAASHPASESEQNASSSSAAAATAAAAQGLRKDIYAESPTTSQQDQHALQDVDTEAAAVLDEVAYQKLRGSKETMYSKLKNRIRVLEDNLNLTNR